jgi:hypothetical protein
MAAARREGPKQIHEGYEGFLDRANRQDYFGSLGFRAAIKQ